MKICFDTGARRTVSDANINYYSSSFVHPSRKMKDHDFIYIVYGEWKIGQNGETFRLKKDSLLILSASQYHYGISPCSPNTKTMYFHVPPEKGDKTELDRDFPHSSADITENLIDASGNPNIKKYFYEIVNAKLSGNDRKASAFFDLLICEILSSEPHTESAEIALQIKNIIHNDPERFFSNAELARRTAVSVKTAENKFKSFFGITIHQYILNFKIEQAIAYFRNFPEMSVKEVSGNLGFYDEYHFSKQFKRITGLAPTEYKKQMI